LHDIPDEEYDVVLCLGVMYHLIDPYAALKLLHKNTKYFAVIDTITHKEPLSALIVVCDKDVDVSLEGTDHVEVHPTYRAMIDLMKAAGFSEILEVVGIPDKYFVSESSYFDQTRRCLICFKDEGLFLLEKIKTERI